MHVDGERSAVRARLRHVGLVLVLALSYYGVGRTGLAAATLPGEVSAFWPPTGLALAALLLGGLRLWPGVAVGALLLGSTNGLPFLSVLGISTGNTVEAVAGAWLVSRLTRGDHTLSRVRDVMAFVVAAALIATMLCATVGVASLYAGGVIPGDTIWLSWRVWWVGDMLGALVVAPLLLSWGGRGHRPPMPNLRSVAVVAGSALLLAGLMLAPDRAHFNRPYLVFPVLIWASLRWRQRGAATATALISVVAVLQTRAGRGTLNVGTTTNNLWLLATFLVTLAVTGLVLAALVSEREAEALSNAELTAATSDLSLDVAASRRTACELADARDVAVAAAAAKATFLATMSHELRTPMNAVIGITGLLLDTPLDAQQREFVETVRASGDALLDIINDILDFSKIDAGALRMEARAFDVVEAMEAAVDLVAADAAAKGLDLVAYFESASERRVIGDPTRFRQVLVNLLANAVKFTESGEVLITIGGAAAGSAAPTIRVAVTDSGIGIPPDAMDRLFDPFSQVDASTTRVYGGSGLGLAICRRLVEAMGGRLTVVSSPGSGSTFAFTLPVVLSPGQDPQHARSATGALAGRRVLVVDDNDTSRRILRLQVEGWGMHCVDVRSAEAAVALAGAGGTWDVTLVDKRLAGSDGATLAAALRELPGTADVPLILLAGVGDHSGLEQQTLFLETVSKPVKAYALCDALDRALSGTTRPPRQHAATAGPPEEAPAGLRVLYAEDNPVNQKVGRLMLARLGHQVDIVGDGREALEAVRARPYDVVLMDIQMPRMDGLEATRRIRSELPAGRRPRIVAMTASALVEDRQACVLAGMDDYLTKPVREADLRAALHPGA